MTTYISKTAVPVVLDMLQALDGIVAKAAARCEATKVAEGVYLEWRVAPDMLPLATQFRFATEIPARGLSRLAGAEIPSFPSDETSFGAFKARIERARAIVSGLDAGALDADPWAEIKVPMGPNEAKMPRMDFAMRWVLPNVCFHVTAAYLILRGLGVDLGKRDYLAGMAAFLPAR